MGSAQAPQESLETRVKPHPRHPLESNNHCFLTGRGLPGSESKDPNAAWLTASPEAYQGPSLGKPLVLQAALHGQSLIGNGKKHSHSKLAKSNGLEGGWSGASAPKDGAGETPRGQDSALASHLASQGSFSKPPVEHIGRSFREATHRWLRTAGGLQCYGKPAKSASPRGQRWGKQLARRPAAGKAPDQENDGYCPDVELSDSEAESEGSKERVRVKREASGREKAPRASKRECRGKRKKTYPLSHSSAQR